MFGQSQSIRNGHVFRLSHRLNLHSVYHGVRDCFSRTVVIILVLLSSIHSFLTENVTRAYQYRSGPKPERNPDKFYISPFKVPWAIRNNCPMEFSNRLNNQQSMMGYQMGNALIFTGQLRVTHDILQKSWTWGLPRGFF